MDTALVTLQHLDFCTHIQFPEDLEILCNPASNVNLRLMRTSSQYNKIIQSICDYIEWSATTKKEGYSQPLGWSGNNAGIPFRIIYVPPYGIMINPQWISNVDDAAYTHVKSNCGSLTLPKKKSVTRVNEINISWFDRNLRECVLNNMTKEMGGFTFQHEYLHLDGKLI